MSPRRLLMGKGRRPASGGSGAISAPTDIAGCSLWLDFADTASVDQTGGIFVVTDKSGRGNNVSQTTGFQIPEYPSSVNILNGHVNVNQNSGRFIGKSVSGSWPSADQLNGGCTLFFLSYPVNTATAPYRQPFLITDGSGIVNVALLKWPYDDGTYPNKQGAYVTEVPSATNISAVPAASITDSVWRLYTVIVTPTSLTLKSNNAALAGPMTIGGSGLKDSTGSVLWVGGDTYNNNYEGFIQEVILYRTTLSSTDQTRVCDYIATKYALTMGTAVP